MGNLTSNQAPYRRRASRIPWVIGVAICLANFSAAAQVADDPPPERPLRDGEVLTLAAGRPSGSYTAVAKALAGQLAASGRVMEVLTTEGSYENVQRVRQGEADLALVQSDVAYLEHFNQRSFQALASIYTEPIHVLAYRGLDLQRLSDLLSNEDSYRAAIGTPGSGSSAHASAVFELLGIPTERLTTVPLSLNEADAQLRSRGLDLAFVTTALPSGEVQKLAGDQIVSLLEIDRDLARRLRRNNPFFVATEIPYETYGLSNRNIQTLGTRMLLVGRPDLDEESVYTVLEALYSIAEAATSESLPFLRELSPKKALRDLSIPIHSAAREYHSERNSFLRINGLADGVVPVVALALLLFALTRLSRFAYFIHQFILGRVLLSLVAVWLLGSVAMYLLEGGKNQAFRSLGASSIAILHYLFSGLESKYPVTPGGHVVAILVLSLGVAVVTLFTATLVTVLVEHALNIRTLRTKPTPFLKLSGHTVIAGWSDRTKRVIRQLRSSDLRVQPKIVVIAPQAAATTVEDRRSFRGVWVVEGDRSQSSSLAMADIDAASSAIILSDDSTKLGSDLSSITCAHAMRRLAPNLYRIVEARGSTNLEHLQRNQVDEVLDTATLSERLICQCIISPGITDVFDELLTFGKNSQEIHLVPLRQRLQGKSFRTIRSRLKTCNLIVLGYWKKDEDSPYLNPARAATDRRLAAGDRLVILADSPKAVTCLRARFKQRRLEMSTAATPTKSPPEDGDPGRPIASTRRTQAALRDVRIGICGWNDEARAVIQNLQDAVDATHQEFKITVIDDPEKDRPHNECSRNVRFVFGDPTHSSVLDNAGLASMQRLVVLADQSDAEDPHSSDHRSLVICLAAKEVNPNIHLIVEVLHSENKEHFERIAGAEIVSMEDLSERLLAQAVISPGITGVFLELFTATEESNELYLVRTPSHWIGLPFSQVASELQEGSFPAIAIGYRIYGGEGQATTVLNPSPQEGRRHGVVDWRDYSLGGSDDLIIMANQEPTW